MTKSPSKDVIKENKSSSNTVQIDDEVESISLNDEDEEDSCQLVPANSPVFKKKSRNREKLSPEKSKFRERKVPPKLSSSSDWDSDFIPEKSKLRERKVPPKIDLSSSSDSDSDFIPSSVKGKDEKVRRSRREKKFCSLSEIDKAKLKNRPFAEREQAYQEIQGGALSSIDCTERIERGENLQLLLLFFIKYSDGYFRVKILPTRWGFFQRQTKD